MIRFLSAQSPGCDPSLLPLGVCLFCPPVQPWPMAQLAQVQPPGSQAHQARFGRDPLRRELRARGVRRQSAASQTEESGGHAITSSQNVPSVGPGRTFYNRFTELRLESAKSELWEMACIK